MDNEEMEMGTESGNGNRNMQKKHHATLLAQLRNFSEVLPWIFKVSILCLMRLQAPTQRLRPDSNPAPPSSSLCYICRSAIILYDYHFKLCFSLVFYYALAARLSATLRTSNQSVSRRSAVATTS